VPLHPAGGLLCSVPAGHSPGTAPEELPLLVSSAGMESSRHTATALTESQVGKDLEDHQVQPSPQQSHAC